MSLTITEIPLAELHCFPVRVNGQILPTFRRR